MKTLNEKFCSPTGEEFQNFVKKFEKGQKNDFIDYVYAPCIMLLSSNGKKVNYCHFDENNLDELKSFLDYSILGDSRKVAFFGGYGSKNVSKLFVYLSKKNFGKITDKDLVAFSPIKKLKIVGEEIIFSGDSEEKIYSFEEMYNILK